MGGQQGGHQSVSRARVLQQRLPGGGGHSHQDRSKVTKREINVHMQVVNAFTNAGKGQHIVDCNADPQLFPVQGAAIGAELKRAGCVHLLDLKPSNFLLDEAATVVLIDLGSAVLPFVSASIPTSLYGTTKYGSPAMLQHLTKSFTDDYHSIIRDGDGIAAFWSAALFGRPLWEECLSEEAVEKCNHEKFRNLVDSCACNAKAS
eukprot:gene38142-50013_t